MKRIVFLLIILLLIPSCGAEQRIPTFESYPLTLSGILTYNGTSCAVTAVIFGKDACEISIDSPENLSGYSFKVDNGSVWVYYDNMQIELKTGSIEMPITLIPEMLAVSREEFEYSRADSENTVYYYTKDSADTTIYIRRAEKLPHCIEYKKGNVSLSFEIESLMVQQGDIDADIQ